MNPSELEDRLIKFSVCVIEICKSLARSEIGKHMIGQLIRSGFSPALNYGEAQSAESRKDFIHKMQISLKELRETKTNLTIIKRASLIFDKQTKVSLDQVLKENDELISIFVKSITTAKRNLK